MRKDLLDQFVAWLDPYVIAEAIKEELHDAGEPVTLENMKQAWLSCLEDIHAHVRVCI